MGSGGRRIGGDEVVARRLAGDEPGGTARAAKVVQGVEDRLDGRWVLEAEGGVGPGAADVEAEEAAGDRGGRDLAKAALSQVVDLVGHPGQGTLQGVGDRDDPAGTAGD